MRTAAGLVISASLLLGLGGAARAAATPTQPGDRADQRKPQDAHETEDAIVTDRPDVAESSQTVGRLRLQVELGVDSETRTLSGGERVTDLRTPLKVRFGITECVEAHLETAGIGYSHSNAGDASGGNAGVDDLDVGGKVHLLDQRGVVPSTGVLLALTLPIGVEELVPGSAFLLSPTLASDWGLPAEFSLAINLGVTIVLSERAENADTLRYAVAIGRSWAPLAESLGTYVEVYGETALDDGTTVLAIDGGFTWLVRRNIQLDLTARAGLTEQAPDVGGALGFSILL